MNNNRGNNRRRGRGNNRPQGGGQQLNRIDSRARGNAPQMLEKYRKLAQDAHLNGDRVQSEYYLQFADHYFRVIADTRLRQEEQRQRTGGERWQEQDGESEDNGDFSVESDFPSFDRPSYDRQDRQERGDRQERQDRGERQERSERPDRAERQDRGERQPQGNREPREPREPRRFEREREPVVEAAPVELVAGVEGEPVDEAASDNPFVRDARPARGLRPRGERRQKRAEPANEGTIDAFDPSSLPPAIGARSEPEPAEAPAEPVAEAPAPKKRGRPRKNPAPEAA